jgi:hypothetical protein
VPCQLGAFPRDRVPCPFPDRARRLDDDDQVPVPIAYALAEGAPVGTYIYWDFWWVVHLWLAWALLRWRPYAYALAIGVSAVEIAIVVTKLALFLPDPNWTIWTTNWFINKLFVLACFCLMLAYFTVRRRDLRGHRSIERILAPGDPEAARR